MSVEEGEAMVELYLLDEIPTDAERGEMALLGHVKRGPSGDADDHWCQTPMI